MYYRLIKLLITILFKYGKSNINKEDFIIVSSTGMIDTLFSNKLPTTDTTFGHTTIICPKCKHIHIYKNKLYKKQYETF